MNEKRNEAYREVAGGTGTNSTIILKKKKKK